MTAEMNEIYESITEKKISLCEGVRRIITLIYLNPQLFGLMNIDADLRSNIMVKLLENLPVYIANYSNARAFFSTYMSAIILNLLKSE